MKKSAKEIYESSASAYADRFMEMDLYNDLYDYFSSLLSEGDALLDIGCGPGNISSYLQSKIAGLEIHGLDFSEPMLSIAKDNIDGGTFYCMDCRDVAQIGRTFDAVISGFCTPYLTQEECGKLIKDIGKITSTNGVVYLSTMEGTQDDSGYEKTSFAGDQEVFINYHEEAFIRQALDDAGFKVKKFDKKEYLEADGGITYDLVFIAQKNQ